MITYLDCNQQYESSTSVCSRSIAAYFKCYIYNKTLGSAMRKDVLSTLLQWLQSSYSCIKDGLEDDYWSLNKVSNCKMTELICWIDRATTR